MSLVLHIGWPKTATSFLQLFFAQNISVLQEEGVLYPEIFDLSVAKQGKYGQGNGYSLAYSLLEDKSVTTCGYPSFTVSNLEKYLGSINNEKTVLISTEWFTVLTADSLRKIKKSANKYNHNVSVIAYLRPIESFLESEYAQGIKQGVVANEFENAVYEIDYLEKLSKFESVFGADNINVRPFLPSMWPGGVIEADFLTQIGISDSHASFVRPNETNVSLHPKLLLLQRFLNSQGLPFSEPDLLLLQDVLFRNNILKKIEPGSWISEEARKDIHKKNSVQAKKLENKYFKGNPFLFCTKNKSVYDKNLLTKSDVISVVNVIRSSPLIINMNKSRKSEFFSKANVLHLLISKPVKQFLEI